MTSHPDARDTALLAELTLGYLDGEIPDESFQLLSERLHNTPQDLMRYIEIVRIATMARELFRLDGAAKRELVAQADPGQNLQELITALSPPEDLEPVDFVEVIRRGADPDPLKFQLRDYSSTSSNAKFAELALFTLRQIPRRVVYGAAAAVLAVAAILIVALSLGGPDQPAEQPFADNSDSPVVSDRYVAELVDVKNASWDTAPGDTAPLQGDRLLPGKRLSLASGFASIHTTRGAVAILQAPTTVEMMEDGNALRLLDGKLVGIVETERAKGFRVLTPSAEIVDLGTRFGVVYDGTTRTTVLEGEVTVQAMYDVPGSEPTLLTKGQSATVDADAMEVDTQTAVSDDFESDWQPIVSLPKLEGEVRFETSMPEVLHYGSFERDWIALFREKAGVRLPADLEVTVDTPGEHFELATLSSTLASGTLVDSYFLHLDLPGEVKANSMRSATITFDRPIVAVISRSTHLAASDAVLGLDGVRHIKGNPVEKKFGGVRGMEPAASRLEAIKISEDRRTLTVDMILMGTSIDQARVLVQAVGDSN